MHLCECKDYTEWLIWLSEALIASKSGRPRSYRKAAQKLGYSSPGMLVFVLSGQRVPGHGFMDRISAFLQLSSIEAEFCRVICNIERKQRGVDSIGSFALSAVRQALLEESRLKTSSLVR